MLHYTFAMAQFPDTQWSLIRRSGDSPSARHVAFGELVRRYRGAIRVYFGARLSADDADDATQTFLSASYEHAWWARADSAFEGERLDAHDWRKRCAPVTDAVVRLEQQYAIALGKLTPSETAARR